MGNSVYLKAWDEFDHHSVILTKSNTAGLAHMAFKVETLDDLAYYEKKIEEFGCTTTRISKGQDLLKEKPFTLSYQQDIIVNYTMKLNLLGTAVGTRNPHPWPLGTKGIAPHRLDHILLTGDDLKTVTRFFIEVLNLDKAREL